MERFNVISFNHQNLPLELVGKLHLDEYTQASLLGAVRANFQFDELMFLSTCNRVEIYLCTDNEITPYIIGKVISTINPALPKNIVEELASKATVLNDEAAVSHVFKVASSLNSLVVGEREIITQLRKAYDLSNSLKLTGDFIRILIKQTIETAKQVFTETDIAKNPVSVVSLAYRQLRDLGIKTDARVLIVGAGETNIKMANYLQKHKFANFTVFNRTLSKAQDLATKLNGTALSLNDLNAYDKGFDVLIICTSASHSIITHDIYHSLLQKETNKKVLIDLSIPAGIEASVIKEYPSFYIDINSLKVQAEVNMNSRLSEMTKCETIIGFKLEEFKRLQKERLVELAFGEIPRQVRAIKDVALTEVFAKEISELDTNSKEVLDKVIGYIEKKYNAVAMKTAKEVFLKDE
ncbi:MAG: glutamyl-tRNA reductase [Sphingobacteriaceae bacterium]|nr:glutamyl-tRNA reductase [Sphingobacteriaceae bacterium]